MDSYAKWSESEPTRFWLLGLRAILNRIVVKFPMEQKQLKIMKELLLSSCTEISQTDLDGLDFNSTWSIFEIGFHQTKANFSLGFF